MTNVKQNLTRSTQLTESDSARLDTEILLGHILGRDRAWLYTWPEYELSEPEQAAFDTLLARRKNGEPVAHLTGTREFWSLPLRVNTATLIPRPDTELLVETALELCPEQELRALDLGTGTGAIALALAAEKPGWQITAAEKSAEALTLAEDNRYTLGFDNVQVLASDWFENIPPQQFDLILSNPPYIDASDPHLQQGDVRFEPRSALVAGRDGLADIDWIARNAIEYLQPGGWLLVEHGWQQAESVRKIFAVAGLQNIQSRRDCQGHERLTIGQKAGGNE